MSSLRSHLLKNQQVEMNKLLTEGWGETYPAL